MTEPTKKPRGKKPKPPEIAIVAPTPEPEVVSIKGFDQNWTCRGFQYEIGKTYEMDGNIEACERGFHACDADHHPLNVFDYQII